MGQEIPNLHDPYVQYYRIYSTTILYDKLLPSLWIDFYIELQSKCYLLVLCGEIISIELYTDGTTAVATYTAVCGTSELIVFSDGKLLSHNYC